MQYLYQPIIRSLKGIYNFSQIILRAANTTSGIIFQTLPMYVLPIPIKVAIIVHVDNKPKLKRNVIVQNIENGGIKV